jgi:predicted LPLAT superfamily acyltransferase
VSTHEKKWTGRSHGSAFGHWLVHLVARYGGVTICYLFIIPPTIVLFFRLHERRRLCMRYWQRMRPSLGRWGQTFMAWRQFYSFARQLADRFLIGVAQGTLRHTSLGFKTLQVGTRHPQGCIILSAHVGNWELSGRFLDQYRLGHMHLVMLQAENPQVAAQVRAALDANGLKLIDLKDPFAASLRIAAALRAGETCCMLGDRTAGNDSGTIAVPFLGGMARFPTGPFIAAATTGAVVVPTFCLKFGWNHYITVAMGPWPIQLGNRRERQAQLTKIVAHWAHCIESIVRRFPLQWHNFYDFWAIDDAVAPRNQRQKLTR